MEEKTHWVDLEIKFYDFIWQEAVQAHTACINRELAKDFAEGGDKFEEMVVLLKERFPTRESALLAFSKSE